MTRWIIAVLNRITRTCWFPRSAGLCRLPYGHATGHQAQPTLREWWWGWGFQGREGDER